ncbi:acyl-CoA thioesterase [Alicyclobacillus shizuokensis]|uniref:acyl-CoA thioesterase n=1 Tax=Alicyclobacillus shizuokensis TaxID=392014 RepID=UPI000836A8BF|nr:thioesterase family protein [Alicyclobacillus shizuokensis]MCL6625826.1 acyl-CoA thioesterase [Alicyclobacillus shizuokensis]
MTWQNEIDITVRSTEIDVNGHVNNAKFLEYLEWGREDWYEQLGLDYATLRDLGVVTVVVNVNANYRREARQNDNLRVRTNLLRVGRTSFVMAQEIVNQRGERILDAEITLVTIDPVARSKVPVPDRIRQYALER